MTMRRPNRKSEGYSRRVYNLVSSFTLRAPGYSALKIKRSWRPQLLWLMVVLAFFSLIPRLPMSAVAVPMPDVPPVNIASVPAPTSAVITEPVGGTNAYAVQITNPGQNPNYKYQFLTNGLRLLIDRKDGASWQPLVSQVRTVSEYKKQSGPIGNFIWNPHGLNLSIVGPAVLQGFDRQNQADGSINLVRTYATFEEGIAESLSETWIIPATVTELASKGPKVTYSMTKNRGIVPINGVVEGTWRMRWEISGIADITVDRPNLVDGDNYPLRKKTYGNGAFTVDLNDFDNLQTAASHTYSEVAVGNKVEVLFLPNGTTGNRVIDPTIATSNISTGWNSNRQRSVFYNGTNSFVLYSKGGTSLFAKAAATVPDLATATEQTVLDNLMITGGDWDVFQVDDTKFDLVYQSNEAGGSTTYVRVRTCTLSGTSITCTAVTAAMASMNAITKLTVTRTTNSNRIWIAMRGASSYLYSANATGDSANVTAWTEEAGGAATNTVGEIALIPYQATDKVILLYQRDPAFAANDGIYSRAVALGVAATEVTVAKGANALTFVEKFGNGVRRADNDFRFVYVNAAATTSLQEMKYSDDNLAWTLAETVDAGGGQVSPALFYDRTDGRQYATYAADGIDTGTEKEVYTYVKLSGGTWSTKTRIDNGEATTNSLPVVQMSDAPYGSSRTFPRKLIWGYLNANGTNYNVTVGIYTISDGPSVLTQAAYRLFANTDSTDVGTPLAAANTQATLGSANTAFRLRILNAVGTNDALINEESFALQYAAKGAAATCSVVATGSFERVVGQYEWTQATAAAGWTARTTPTAVFNNKLWVMGGRATAVQNDVWSSSDGITWTQETAAAGWPAREGHTTAVFGGKLWVMGGRNGAGTSLNDVWSSSDGITWTQATAAAGWSVRFTHTTAVFGGKLWVMGGKDSANLNDVWSSSDGITWTQETAAAGWSIRQAHTTAVFNNKLWVMGGRNGTTYLNDVWSSSDGITWTQETAAAGWNIRGYHSAAVFNNKLWTLAGVNTGGYFNDVWSSSDGITWTQETAAAGWAARYTSTAVYSNKLWIMGGSTASPFRDVWSIGNGISFYDNPTPASATALTANASDPTDGTNPIVNQTYVESNSFSNSIAAIPAGQDGKWDFSLKDNNAPAGTNYCFRIVKANNTLLDNYTVMPEVSTAAAPTTPSTASLAQLKTTDATLATGAWTNESSVKFTASVSDPNPSDTLQLCIEIKPIATAFTGTENSCGAGVAYNGTAVTATHTITGLTDTTQYHWQARVKDAGGLYSGWAVYGGNLDGSPADVDVGIDMTAPTGGTVYDGTTTGVDSSFNDGSLASLSANWGGFVFDVSGISKYEYSIGTTPGGTDTRIWTNLNPLNSTSVIASSLTLQTSKVYYFNVRATDTAGNTVIRSSDGQLIVPTISFDVTPSAISFSRLNASNSYTDSQTTTLTTSTNAYGGYVIRSWATGLPTAATGATFGNFTGGSYASPDSWLSGDTGFGYTSNDTDIQGTNKFQAATCPGGSALAAPGCFATFTQTGPGDIVADHTTNVSGTSIANEQFTITYRVTAAPNQPPSKYSTSIVYSVTPIY